MGKCKQCKTTVDVVKYCRGLNYRGVKLPVGSFCHDCMRAVKKDIDTFFGLPSEPRDEA